LTETATMPVSEIRYVPELYPRLKPLDDVVERYRDAIDNLPPIAIARDGVLVDGYHRWQAHVREGRDTITAEHLGDLADAEIVRESIRRNATHGQQFTRTEKKRLAGMLWGRFSDFSLPDRVKEIRDLLAVSERSVQEWTKDARADEKKAQQEKVWDLWLDCHEQEVIADQIGVDQATISRWLMQNREDAEMHKAPESRQHFDVWQFPHSDKDAGQQSYFGALPPQVIENLLWFWTEPGEIVADLFAGSGTTVDVAKAMGRRVWASDIRGAHYSPHLPIRQHDASAGWPDDAPRKADLLILDPPYWQQAAGRYSSEPGEMAELDLAAFYGTWANVVKAAMEHARRIAYIISPTQLEDGQVVDHATDMLAPFHENGWRVERRIIVPYQTQQATGQQVEWARKNKRLLKLYRDLVVMGR
jgi:DNA methylase